jgi:hypothetical protein
MVMNTVKIFRSLMLVCLLSLASCYTALRGPATADNSEESTDLRHFNVSPSVPDSRLESYEWLYYYQSAWWQDDLVGWGGDQVPAATPEEYRRRFPSGEPSADGTVGLPGQTVSAPGLSKGAAGAAQQPEAAAKPTDLRRDFNSGSTSPAQPVNPSAGDQTVSGRRDFQSGSRAPGNQEEKNPPKHK